MELKHSGGSKGGRGTRAPPLAQNFFILMQFSGKIDPIIGWRPPFGVSAPSSGKSWIRHCKGNDLLLLQKFADHNSKALLCKQLC